jgi:hypothetical protein
MYYNEKPIDLVPNGQKTILPVLPVRPKAY